MTARARIVSDGLSAGQRGARMLQRAMRRAVPVRARRSFAVRSRDHCPRRLEPLAAHLGITRSVNSRLSLIEWPRTRQTMDSVDIEVLRTAEAWRKEGRRVTLGTIVKTWGSAPRPVGAMVVIRDDGQVIGSVSGGCVEDDLIEKVRAKAVAAERPQLVTYGVTNEEATRWGLPCGGTLQVGARAGHRAQRLSANCSRRSASSSWCAAPRHGDRRGHARRPAAGRTCSNSTARCSAPCTARAGACS